MLDANCQLPVASCWMNNPFRAFMTERLYYTDSFLHEFEARVVAVNGETVMLDRSAFYPTSGGQVFDTGWLEVDGSARLRVKEVNENEQTGDVLHVVENARVCSRVPSCAAPSMRSGVSITCSNIPDSMCCRRHSRSCMTLRPSRSTWAMRAARLIWPRPASARNNYEQPKRWPTQSSRKIARSKFASPRLTKHARSVCAKSLPRSARTCV